MRITTAFPVRSLSGTFKTSNLVYATIQDATYARLRVKPADPRTEDQLVVRAFLAQAVRAWHLLTAQQRADWEAYARACRVPGRHTRNGRLVLGGHSLYVRACTMRQLLGLDVPEDAPWEPPPHGIGSVEQVPAAPDHVALRLHHYHGFTGGLQVVVRATKGFDPGRRPGAADHRCVCGVNSASATALPGSGGVVEFALTRFPVEAGQRFGVEVRVVRTVDGMVSHAVRGDFLKEVLSP